MLCKICVQEHAEGLGVVASLQCSFVYSAHETYQGIDHENEEKSNRLVSTKPTQWNTRAGHGYVPQIIQHVLLEGRRAIVRSRPQTEYQGQGKELHSCMRILRKESTFGVRLLQKNKLNEAEPVLQQSANNLQQRNEQHFVCKFWRLALECIQSNQLWNKAH